MLLANLFESVNRRDAIGLPQRADALRAQALDLEQLERRGRIHSQHLIAPLEAAALFDFLERGGHALADSRNVGDLLVRVLENARDLLGISFDDARGVAVTADAEAILTRDLHQVRGFRQQARDFAIIHWRLRNAASRVAQGTARHAPARLPPIPDALPAGA